MTWLTGATRAAQLPTLVTLADRRHGVSAYARDVAREIERLVGVDLSADVAVITGDDPPERAHLHFTDRLWASSPEAAAERLESLARRTRLTVTLHDLPQPSDGQRNLERRAACYSRVIAACHGVVVNSHHEAALLAEHCTTSSARVGVIPLPVTPAAPIGVRPASDGSVAVIGFFYPGKGHAEVVDAVASFAEPPPVVALGRASDGHEGELAALVDEAAARGVHFGATGWLDDADLLDRCRRAAVPVAAHRHVSASGSIATWIAAGRRPLVPRSRYSSEMATLRPGTLTIVDEHDPDARGFADAIEKAMKDPESTWITEDAVTRPDLADTAEAYLDWFETGSS